MHAIKCHRFFHFLFIFYAGVCFSGEEACTPLRHEDLSPDGVVNGSVNVVNGSYFEMIPVVTMAGIDPVQIVTMYSTYRFEPGTFSVGWKSNLGEYLRTYTHWNSEVLPEISVMDSHGRELSFKGPAGWDWDKSKAPFRLSKDFGWFGLCNDGEAGGQRNARNAEVHYYSNQDNKWKRCWARFGDGSWREYIGRYNVCCHLFQPKKKIMAEWRRSTSMTGLDAKKKSSSAPKTSTNARPLPMILWGAAASSARM